MTCAIFKINGSYVNDTGAYHLIHEMNLKKFEFVSKLGKFKLSMILALIILDLKACKT